MYNNNFIDAFPEDEYIKLLNSPSLMSVMEDEYLNKYNSGSNTYFITIKESLDHYMAKKIDKDKNFVNSSEFDIYMNSLKNIYKKNTESFGLKKIYIEPSVNIIFNYLDKDTIGKYFSNFKISINNKSNDKLINNIFDKIDNSIELNDKELSFIASYLDTRKVFDDNYDKYIDYIFNNLGSIKPNIKILSSILSYIGKDKTRLVMGSYDLITDVNNDKINIAHCNPNFSYSSFDIEYFSNIDLNSFDSVKYSRSTDYNDIVFLIFTAYHELTHQKQKDAVKNNDFRGASLDIANAIKSVFKDSYSCNHDASEIEIDADENGWKETAKFVEKYINKDLSKQCIKNSEAVSLRRLFSKKKIPKINRVLTNIEYDMKLLSAAVKKKPEIVDKFPTIEKIMSKEGAYKTTALFKDIIVDTPAGWEFSNYILNNVPVKFLVDKINSGDYSDKEVLNLLNNFIEVPHKNTILIKKLRNVDIETYKYTETHNKKIDKEEIYNDFFCECATSFITFNKVLDAANKKFPKTINKNKVSSYNNFYVNNYYYEMLNNITNPNMDRIERIMKCYDNLDSNELKLVSEMTRNYLKDKNGNKEVDILFDEAEGKDSIIENHQTFYN